MDASQKKECFKLISENILSEQWKKVGKNLGLEEPDLNAIYADCRIRGDGSQEIYLQMLLKWEHKFPERVNVPFLCKALKNSDRADLAEKITGIQVARGTKCNSSNASNVDFQMVNPTDSRTSSSNQNIREKSSVAMDLNDGNQRDNPVAANLNNVIPRDNPIPGTRQYYYQIFRNKLYIGFAIIGISASTLMYYGRASSNEFLHGAVEGFMTYGNLHSIGYGLGKLLGLS